ncbi:MAG: dethiobiotin synthetase [Gaiellaceae bacterium]|jgi:dethiobiotin synthetase|nr:dethiobiotin synthetase [Gaiellaceae bacterium]
MRGFFVTATGTGVGKTVVTGALARALRAQERKVAVFKPVQSGALADDPSGDAALLGADNVYAFEAALAPLVAARRAGVTIELEQILRRADRLVSVNEVVLVEGAGGLLVPLADNLLVADLARALGLPLVIVARAGLGTVNHTLLTIEAARARDLPVAAVVLNGEVDESTDDNAELIGLFGHGPLLLRVPHLDDPATAEEHLAELVALA